MPTLFSPLLYELPPSTQQAKELGTVSKPTLHTRKPRQSVSQPHGHLAILEPGFWLSRPGAKHPLLPIKVDYLPNTVLFKSSEIRKLGPACVLSFFPFWRLGVGGTFCFVLFCQKGEAESEPALFPNVFSQSHCLHQRPGRTLIQKTEH